MTTLTRALWVHSGKPRTERRYKRFGLYDAHTGERVGKKYRTRDAAAAAAFASGNHALRVQGIPSKKKAKA